MKVRFLALAAMTVGVAHLHADLDENQFKRYTHGDLHEQEDWFTQGVAQEGAGYSDMLDRGEVRRDPNGVGKLLVWLAGHSGFEQSRFIKKFPPTTGDKCQVEFEIKPGASEAGQIFLDQQGVGALTIRFVRGGIGLLDASGEVTEQILDRIEWDEWVKVKLNVDFEKHVVEFFVNQRSIGTYPISEALTSFDQLNIFGGGAEFETQLRDLKIDSVSRFK